MKRYFFDIVGHAGSTLDYTGRLMPSLDAAYVAAEMIALDIAVREAEEPLGSKVTI